MLLRAEEVVTKPRLIILRATPDGSSGNKELYLPLKHGAQWSDRVTKTFGPFSNIETFLHFLNAFGYRKIIYPC